MKEISYESFLIAETITLTIINAGAVSMSWGFDIESIKLLESGLAFHVQGFNHTGCVEILFNKRTERFDITFISDDADVKKETIENVTLDNLVDVIDNYVEYTGDDYEERVEGYMYEQSYLAMFALFN